MSKKKRDAFPERTASPKTKSSPAKLVVLCTMPPELINSPVAVAESLILVQMLPL